MTAYNREQYIGEAIESVLKSSYSNFELVILDDGSHDETFKIARRYEELDTRVRVYFNQTNLGQFQNRNKILKYAKGELVKYFDSDDVMYAHCLEKMVEAMLKFPDAIAAAEHHRVVEQLPICYSPRELYVNHFFNGNNLLMIGPSGAIFKKKAFDEFGAFDTEIGILADTLFMLKIAAHYPVVGFETDTFLWRRHDHQVTIGQEDKAAMALQRKKINDITLSDTACPFSLNEKELVAKNLNSILIRNMVCFLVTGNIRAALEIYKNCDFSYQNYFAAFFRNKRLSL